MKEESKKDERKEEISKTGIKKGRRKEDIQHHCNMYLGSCRFRGGTAKKEKKDNCDEYYSNDCYQAISFFISFRVFLGWGSKHRLRCRIGGQWRQWPR